jgi:hypothetical protein
MSPWEAYSLWGGQESSYILWNTKVHYHVYQILVLVPILSQRNPGHTFPYYLLGFILKSYYTFTTYENISDKSCRSSWTFLCYIWVPGALSLGVKRPGREADHSPPSSADVKDEWSYTSAPPILLHGVVLSYAQGQLHLYLLPYTFLYDWVQCIQNFGQEIWKEDSLDDLGVDRIIFK